MSYTSAFTGEQIDAKLNGTLGVVVTGTSFNGITALSSTTPIVDGTAAIGNGTTAARGNHVHPTNTLLAVKADETFTGVTILPSTTSIGSVNATEISYLDGVTSALQTQMNLALAGASNKAFATGALTVNGYITGKANSDTLRTGAQIYVTNTEQVALRVGSANDFNIDTYNAGTNTNVLKITQAGAISMPGAVSTGALTAHTPTGYEGYALTIAGATEPAQYSLKFNAYTVTGGVIGWALDLVNAGTTYPNLIKFDRQTISMPGAVTMATTGNVLIGATTNAGTGKLQVTGGISATGTTYGTLDLNGPSGGYIALKDSLGEKGNIYANTAGLSLTSPSGLSTNLYIGATTIALISSTGLSVTGGISTRDGIAVGGNPVCFPYTTGLYLRPVATTGSIVFQNFEGTVISTISATGLTVTGKILCSATTPVDNASGAILQVTGAATVSGALTVGGKIISGTNTDNGLGTLQVTGNATISGIIGATPTGALRMSVGTTAQRPASPEDGMIRMNSSLCRPEYYSSIMAQWIPFSAAGGIPNIGDPFGGGYFAGYISAAGNGIASHMLIVAPKATGESVIAWDTTVGGSVTGFTSVVDGYANTTGLALLGTCYAAATWAKALTIGGFSDWYIPAKNELEVAYHNLKNVSQDNYSPGSYGSNANAVPPLEAVSTAYTATSPAQTTVAAFKVGNSEAFAGYGFWSSTEYSAPSAWYQDFHSGAPGAQGGTTKTYTGSVRAFRRLSI